jgi:hypothetical protein
MQEWHSIWDMVVKNKARTSLQEEPLKNQHMGRDIGQKWKYHWNTEPRLRTAATSEEGENNRQRIQRTELETAATSRKQDNTQQDLQGDPSTADHKENSQDFH